MHKLVTRRFYSGGSSQLPSREALHIRTRVWDGLWWLMLLSLSFAAVCHFGLILVAVMPGNPASLHLQTISRRYVNPFLTQNWAFFAPTPSDRSIYVVAVGTRQDGSRTTPVDVSSPLYAEVARNRLGSMTAVELMVANAAQSYDNAAMASLADKDGRAAMKSGRTLEDVDPTARDILRRLGASAVQAMNAGASFKSIEISILTKAVQRYSRRGLPDDSRFREYQLPSAQFPVVEPYPALRGKSNA